MEGDPIIGELGEFGYRIEILPSVLNQSISAIKKALNEPAVYQDIKKWVEILFSMELDLGVTIWGRWVPPVFFNVPRFGFINYHPAPLPELRGMEPDTFAILQGRKRISGTVHIVDEEFDCGDIVRRSKNIRIKKTDTPVSVLKSVDEVGIDAVIKAISDISKGRIKKKIQRINDSSMATLMMARKFSILDWDKDNIDMIDRKYRAFFGQDISIRLKVPINGKVFAVELIDYYKGHFKGKNGEVIGYYRGADQFKDAPIIKCIDGVVVIKAGDEIEDPLNDTAHPSKVIAAVKRKHDTQLNELLFSIKNNK